MEFSFSVEQSFRRKRDCSLVLILMNPEQNSLYKGSSQLRVIKVKIHLSAHESDLTDAVLHVADAIRLEIKQTFGKILLCGILNIIRAQAESLKDLIKVWD